MEVIRSRSLIFHVRDGRVNDEAVIACHGGYTPRQGKIRTGSGKVQIPGGIELLFYTHHDHTCIGTRSAWAIAGQDISHLETDPHQNELITNYSLSYNHVTDNYAQADQARDTILVKEDKKAHLSDVFKVIKSKKLNYDVIHCFFCRVNKNTFEMGF